MAKVHIDEQTFANWRKKYGAKIEEMVNAVNGFVTPEIDEVWIKFKKSTPIISPTNLYDMQIRYDKKRLKNKTVKTILTVTLSVIAN